MSREDKLREMVKQEQAIMREIYGFDAGVAWAEARIIKLLKNEAANHKQISESIAMDDYMSDSDSESEWWASVVLDKIADALIKGKAE